MSRVSAPTREAAVPQPKEYCKSSAPTQKAKSPTVIEHVLSRLKDIGITKVFGVAGDFALPIEDAIVGFPGIDWVGCLVTGAECIVCGRRVRSHSLGHRCFSTRLTV